MSSEIDISAFKNISSHDKNAWQKIVASWEAGNESQTQFCQRRGLNKNTFCYWRGRFLKMAKKTAIQANNKEPATTKLLPVKLASLDLSVPSKPMVMQGIRLQTPQGYALSMPSGVSVDFLVSLLQRLGVSHA
jgi:hypothetical protein